MRIAAMAIVVLLAASVVPAQEDAAPEPEHDVRLVWGALFDLRAARGSAETPWLASGFGKTRYGAHAEGGRALFALAQASFVADAELTPILTAHVQANFDAEPDPALLRATAGLVEAFAVFRPEPKPRLRLRLKGGMFFPPISFEHPGKGWSTVHSITPSAINAWVGEELRATGVEGTAAFRGDRHELSATAALFANNDPAGTLLSWRGWALHDRQTTTFDRLPLPPLPSFAGPDPVFSRQAPWDAPIREVDGRLGYYVGAAWSMDGLADLRAMFWDNNADPVAFDGFQYGWYTEFLSAGARVRLPRRIEVIAQYMDGITEMGELPGGALAVDNRFRAGFLLATGAAGRHRLTARYDAFDVDDRDPLTDLDPNAEDGSAWTAAYQLALGESTRLAVEWLRVESARRAREGLGLPAEVTENQLQASLRLVF